LQQVDAYRSNKRIFNRVAESVYFHSFIHQNRQKFLPNWKSLMIEINAWSCFIAQVLCAAMLRPSDRSGTFKADTALDEKVKTTFVVLHVSVLQWDLSIQLLLSIP